MALAMTEGLFLIYKSFTTPPSEIKDFVHLPLHRGGFGVWKSNSVSLALNSTCGLAANDLLLADQVQGNNGQRSQQHVRADQVPLTGVAAEEVIHSQGHGPHLGIIEEVQR